jgi:serine/threonine-protein kinase
MAIQYIGRYRILRELGRGATAMVYLARDPGSGRQVAVKVLAAEFTAAPDFDQRFQREVKALAAFDHPYLVAVQDYGRDGEQYFVVSRYLPGGTLADRMDGRPMLLAEVVPILQRVAEALDAAHSVHLVHGDVNPADVLFDLHERAFLADVGLARLLDPSTGPSPTGTPAYTSPEQVDGQPIDGRADVYALGVMLFEMLTGRQPFAAETPEQLLHQHVEQPPPHLSAEALSQLVLPLEFNLVIARALVKIRDYRYPTAGVLAEAVRTMFLMAPADSSAAAPSAGEPVAANAPPPPPIEPHVAAPAEPPEPDLASVLRHRPEALAMPAVATTVAADSAPLPPLAELVREPETLPVSQVSPVLIGLAGLGLIIVLLAVWRWPDIKGFLMPTTATATASATVPAAVQPSDTPSPMPSATASASPSLTPTVSPTLTPTPSPTDTATITPSPSDTPTATATATRRPIVPTFTATP